MNTEQKKNLTLDELLALPGITPEQLSQSKLLPLSRNLIYAACNTGEIENFRIGRKIIIKTAALRRRLGLTP